MIKHREYAYKYGKTKVHFTLNADLIIDDLCNKEYPSLPDPVESVKAAIRNAIGVRPLRAGL